MLVSLTGPEWFRGVEFGLELVYALVTLSIALLSYKIYRIAHDKQFKYFSMAFGLMTVAYLVMSFAIGTLHYGVFGTTILSVFDMPFFLFMSFTLLAYTVLSFVMLKIDARRERALIMGLVGLLILFSYQYVIKFYLVAFLLLFVLSVQFYLNYNDKKSLNSKLVFVSFGSLALSKAFLLGSIVLGSFYSFIIGHIVQFVGFGVLFYVLIRVLRWGNVGKNSTS